jgi:hypothetical protein
MSSDGVYIDIQQICIGLHIKLDLGWMDHPFSLNSFKIKDQKQIDTLKSLGLSRIRYFPEKSDSQPLPSLETRTRWSKPNGRASKN